MKAKLFALMCNIMLAIVLIITNTAMANAQNIVSIWPFDSNRQVAVLTRYDVKKEYQQQFRTALRNYVIRSLANEGNIMSEAYYEQDVPSILWVIERWKSKREFERFSQSRPSRIVQQLASVVLFEPARVIYMKDLEPLSDTEWQRTQGIDDKPLTIMLFVDVRPGTENIFKSVYHIAMPLFRSEAGVINYQLSQLEGDNTQFVTYEKFRDEGAFQYHLHFPPIQPVIDYLNTSIKKQPFQRGLHRLIELKAE